jgi:tetratricopeptide (TPR) repeat protein
VAKKTRLKLDDANLKEPIAPVALKPLAPTPTAKPEGRPPEPSFVDDLVALGLGLLCLPVARAVEPGIRDLFQLPKQLYLADGAALLVMLIALLAYMGRPLRLPRTPLLWPFLVLFGSIVLSLAFAPAQTGGVLSIFAKYDLHRWAAATALFGVTLVGISAPHRLWYVLGGLVIAGLWVSLIGIGEQHKIEAFLPQDWIERRVAIISKPGSTFGNRNMAAELIVAVLPACYVLLAMGLRWWVQARQLSSKSAQGGQDRDKRPWAVAMVAAGTLALLTLLYYLMLTVTRSAWAGAILGLVGAAMAWLAGGLWAKSRAPERAGSTDAGLFGVGTSTLLKPVLAGVLLIGGIAVAADHNKPASEQVDAGDAKRSKSVVQLLKSFFENSKAYEWRKGMWQASWQAMQDNPLGGGAGNWRVIYPKYLTPHVTDPTKPVKSSTDDLKQYNKREKNDMFSIAKQPIRAHQDFLQFGVEYGFQGLLALLALLGLAFFLTVRAVAHAVGPEDADKEGRVVLTFGALASLAGIIAICGDAMASFPLQLPAPTFLFALHLGVIGAADWWLSLRDPAEPARPVSKQTTWTLAGLGAGGFAFLVGLGFAGKSVIEGLHERWMVAEKGFTDGRSLQKSGRPGEGLTEIRKAIAYNPDDFQNHFIEALNLNSLGRTEDAIQSIEASVKLYPNLLNAWVNLAMFNRRAGHDDKMIAAIQMALKLKPDELVALNTWAQWLEDKSRHQEILDLLRPQLCAVKFTEAKHNCPPGRLGYAAYRKTPEWPIDDNDQLLGSYKTALKHAGLAARALKQHAEAAVYFQLLDDEGVPARESEKSKKKQWLQMASDVATEYAEAGQWDKALPYAKRAAEIAEASRADLKRAYAVAAARNGDWATAGHEAKVALMIDQDERAALVEALTAARAARPQDPATADEVLKSLQAPSAPPADPP